MANHASEPSDSANQTSMVTAEFPAEFWASIEALAERGGVTPEVVIAAGTSLYSLALTAKEQNHKLAIVELEQPCITEVTGL